jgi:hypothetical protein
VLALMSKIQANWEVVGGTGDASQPDGLWMRDVADLFK